jgi:GNAT superfamily N-acetyltransferase
MSARGHPPSAARIRRVRTKLRAVVFVHPAAQGQGTGSALLQALHTDAAGLGRDTLTVWTAAANLPARRLYSAHGYRLTGHEKKPSDGRRILQYER